MIGLTGARKHLPLLTTSAKWIAAAGAMAVSPIVLIYGIPALAGISLDFLQFGGSAPLLVGTSALLALYGLRELHTR